MITKIYVDNFRCLVNFEISLRPNQLWLGDNGTGKTSVLDALRAIQSVLTGDHVEDVFTTDDLTAWQTNDEQTFRVETQIGRSVYLYELLIQHDRKSRRCRIGHEGLVWNGYTFYLFEHNRETQSHDAHLFRINRDSGEVEEGTKFSADWSRSMIQSIAERDDNEPLVRFRQSVARWLIVQPVPTTMKPLAEMESRVLDRDARNFADWYRHLCLEESAVGFTAHEHMTNVLNGFEALNLRESGDARRLVATFRAEDRDFRVAFDRLSDGQRQLIALYVFLSALKTSYRVLLVDEPDNFVSLREIQPWLAEVQELCSESDRQAIVISHHPETVNMLADGTELWFHRPNAGHVQVKPYPVHEGLSPAETMARGWDDG